MTIATFFSTDNKIGIDVTQVYQGSVSVAGTYAENVQPSPPFTPGTMAWAANGSAAVYVTLSTGGATGTGYVIVVPLGDYTKGVMMSNSVGNLGDKIGVWLGSGAGASADSGWIQLYGTNAAVQTNVAAVSVAMASTTTAGQIDDATGSGTKNISGLFLTVAKTTSAGLAPCELNWPVVGSTN